MKKYLSLFALGVFTLSASSFAAGERFTSEGEAAQNLASAMEWAGAVQSSLPGVYRLEIKNVACKHAFSRELVVHCHFQQNIRQSTKDDQVKDYDVVGDQALGLFNAMAAAARDVIARTERDVMIDAELDAMPKAERDAIAKAARDMIGKIGEQRVSLIEVESIFCHRSVVSPIYPQEMKCDFVMPTEQKMNTTEKAQ